MCLHQEFIRQPFVDKYLKLTDDENDKTRDSCTTVAPLWFHLSSGHDLAHDAIAPGSNMGKDMPFFAAII